MKQAFLAYFIPLVLVTWPSTLLAKDDALPPLVGLDEGPKKKEVVIGAAHRIDKPRIAIMEPQMGPGIAPKTGRRFLKRLSKALEGTKKVSPILHPTHLRTVLSLADQQRLLGCGSRECVQDLGQLIPLDLVLLVSIRKVSMEPLAVIRAHAPDGGERFTHRQVLPKGELKPDKAILLANRVVSVLGQVKTSSGKAASTVSPVSSGVVTPGRTEPAGETGWLRSVGFGAGLGGIGLIGTSYATLNQAQESFDARPITRSTVDTLAAAEGRARVLWGAGLALGGLSVVSLALGH